MKAVAAVVIALTLFGGCAYVATRERVAAPAVDDDGAVVFTFYAPAATRVQLAGDWPENNWARGDGSAGEADIGLMSDDGNGLWSIAVPLEPGRYRYLFWVDEARWHLDPGNPEDVAGGPGGRASLLTLFRRGGRLEIR